MSTCRCMNDVSGVRGNSDAVVMIDDESSGTIPWQSHAVQRKTVVTKIFVVRPCPTYMFSTCRRCTCTCESTMYVKDMSAIFVPSRCVSPTGLNECNHL